MNKQEWIQKFATLLNEKTEIGMAYALSAAETAADDVFEDGDTPEEAVENELSYWGEQ